MNGWFTNLVTEAINPVFVMVGRTLLSAPPPSALSRVRELSGHVRLVANALLVLMVLAGGVIVMAYGSVQTSTTAREVTPRLVVATITLNTSLPLCQYAIDLANALVEALLGAGVNGERAGNLLAGRVATLIGDPKNILLFLVVLVGAAVLMAVLLAFIAVLRIALLLFLIIAAPMALLCHALPQTEGVARLWWRAFAGLLIMQVLQALVLILAFKVFLTDSFDAFGSTRTGNPSLAAVQPTASRAVDALILIGLFYVLIKIPGWVTRTVWQQAQPQLLKRLIKAVIVYKTLGAASGAFGKALGRRRYGTAVRRTSAHRSRPPRPGGGPAGHAPGNRPPAPRGPKPVTPTASATQKPPASSRPQAPRQLALPFPVTPAAPPPPSQSATARQGRQLALPFPVTRVPRPPTPAPPPPADRPWIRPRPPYVQDRLPGMPTRAPRPGQLRLRLDPPPRRTPRRRQEGR
ncbi:hypothetical protein [Sinosporangium siamense]|uniref:TrbL/VirB6 plasmid conjugal transfer protein n=1 Tax=Sinosporangium siamense TaxID=1367973 RepID=A0A919RN89_9ACTN|nr:hypothetical protein [Sinosporangium siamense]GII96297.1 hypothetical protein Ssi02_65280 [Sinosporangium siamense]